MAHDVVAAAGSAAAEVDGEAHNAELENRYVPPATAVAWTFQTEVAE